MFKNWFKPKPKPIAEFTMTQKEVVGMLHEYFGEKYPMYHGMWAKIFVNSHNSERAVRIEIFPTKGERDE